MNTLDALKLRRSYYNLDDKVEVSDEKIVETIEEVTELVPDAFNMKSQRLVIAQKDMHKKLWDGVYESFGGEVSRDKIDTFKNAAGTVLFFYDNKLIEKMKKDYELYKDNFTPWALQANGMLQISIWSVLEELGLGVNIQHYNPIIDDMVKEMFDVDKDYVLLGQMVYGNITGPADEKEKEDIKKRVKVVDK
ncbi:MAG: nitroreductase family protein [Anaerococcus sp.]|nr:nitroreductase family protein [Peptoniphilaceae bacterium]MDY3055037.1 nitroreductase family protein [Anaerococcus sp.]